MPLPKFQFSEPGSLDEACRLLADAGENAAVIAGGTDLLVKMKQGRVKPELVVSIARLRGNEPPLEADGGKLRIRPLATMSELGSHPDLRGTFRSIAEGALMVGSPQIRNLATVGGNLVSARPCADSAPPLLCWDARLSLASGAVACAVSRRPSIRTAARVEGRSRAPMARSRTCLPLAVSWALPEA